MKTYEEEMREIKELSNKIEEKGQVIDLLKLIDLKNNIPILKDKKITFRLSQYNDLLFEFIEDVINDEINIKCVEDVFIETKSFLLESIYALRNFAEKRRELFTNLKIKMIENFGIEKTNILINNMFDDYIILDYMNVLETKEIDMLYNLCEIKYNLKF